MSLWSFDGETETPRTIRSIFGEMTKAEWWKLFGAAEGEDDKPSKLSDDELRRLKGLGIEPGLGIRLS